MSVIVAEYLGVRADACHNIHPIQTGKGQGQAKPTLPCPFKNSHCDKAKRGDKPICSVRDSNTNQLWIVCSHRLCATSPKKAALNEYQKSILMQVARVIFDDPSPEEVLVDREVQIPVTVDSDYSADYVMWRKNPQMMSAFNPERPVVLEMQGGGETTSTGDLTKHIAEWESGNAVLTDTVSKTAPLVTNAWRRQQEQFLVKGNVAMLTGGRMVFCIGSMIYDYLVPRLQVTTKFTDLKNANWTLALITFIEDPSGEAPPAPADKSIPLKIDATRTIFTNYASFVQAITNQGAPSDKLFDRPYISLAD